MRRGGASASFTVRHVAYGIGVERTFPLYSPFVEKVEIVRHGKVRRAKLYYLRGLSGKEARRKIKRVERTAKEIGEEVLGQPPEEVVELLTEETPVQAEAVAQASALDQKPAQQPPEATLKESKEATPATETPQDVKPEEKKP